MKPVEIPFAHYVIVDPVEIGEFSYVGEYSHISQYTKIGRYCSISNLCTVGAQPHRTDLLTTFPTLIGALKVPEGFATVIEHDVWVGSNSVVLYGVKIGSGAIIGAGCVVTTDVPPYAIVMGTPGRIIRYRFSEDRIRDLLETRWWDFPKEKVTQLPVDDVDKCIETLKGWRLLAA